jgi:hypothetical protein
MMSKTSDPLSVTCIPPRRLSALTLSTASACMSPLTHAHPTNKTRTPSTARLILTRLSTTGTGQQHQRITRPRRDGRHAHPVRLVIRHKDLPSFDHFHDIHSLFLINLLKEIPPIPRRVVTHGHVQDAGVDGAARQVLELMHEERIADVRPPAPAQGRFETVMQRVDVEGAAPGLFKEFREHLLSQRP